MTLGELKSRIADELNRDDLDTQIGNSITAAIQQWGRERFWRTVSSQTATTTLGGQYATLPEGMRTLDIVQVLDGSTYWPLTARPLATIDDWQGATTSSGVPSDYAVENTRIRLYPTPDAVYTLTFVGVFSLPALADDTDTNFWTEEAADLIAATVKYRIYRDIIRNSEAMTFAKVAEKEALDWLTDETTRKLSTGLRGWL